MNDLIKILKERLRNAELDYQLCLENIDYPLSKADELRGNILAYRDCINLLERFNVTQKLERLEELEKESQELKQDVEDVLKDYKDAALKMFKYVEVIDKFIDYLDKKPSKSIPKHSIKQTLNKLLKEVLENE